MQSFCSKMRDNGYLLVLKGFKFYFTYEAKFFPKGSSSKSMQHSRKQNITKNLSTSYKEPQRETEREDSLVV